MYRVSHTKCCIIYACFAKVIYSTFATSQINHTLMLLVTHPLEAILRDPPDFVTTLSSTPSTPQLSTRVLHLKREMKCAHQKSKTLTVGD